MNKIYNNEILERAMIALNCKKVNEIASIFNITPQNLNGYLKRGSFIKLISHEIYKRKININWIETGHGDMMMEMPSIAPISEPQQPYNAHLTAPNIPLDLLSKTAAVLGSPSIFSSALKSNIEAFHTAILFEDELNNAQRKIRDLENKMKSIEDRLLPLEKIS